MAVDKNYMLQAIKLSLYPIKPLLEDPDITDIFIYGSNKVHYKKRGERMCDTDIKFRDDNALYTLAVSIGANMGRDIGSDKPIMDARLPDGSRVNIVVKPVYSEGAAISIRKFPEEIFTLEDIANFGTIDKNGMDLLRILMIKGCNIVIAGGTGSGKTTLLNALCEYIPIHNVVVTCEDTREISVPCKYWVPFETMNSLDPNIESVTLTNLIHTSLRQTPDWIIVGEIRGGEAQDLIRAFNTGHHGIGTLHSISALKALSALEMMSMQSKGAENIPLIAMRMMIADSVQIVVHIDNFKDHRRRITEIIEVTGLDYSKSNTMPEYTTNTLYKYVMDGYDRETQMFVGHYDIINPPTWLDEIKYIPEITIPYYWEKFLGNE